MVLIGTLRDLLPPGRWGRPAPGSERRLIKLAEGATSSVCPSKNRPEAASSPPTLLTPPLSPSFRNLLDKDMFSKSDPRK